MGIDSFPLGRDPAKQDLYSFDNSDLVEHKPGHARARLGR